MERIGYWLQRADYTSTEHDAVDVEAVVHVLHSHDWLAELNLERERESAGLETCPPGIGFVADGNRILHICPGPDGAALVHYHIDESRLVARTIPLLVGFGAVMLSGVTAWKLASGTEPVRSSLAVVTGMIGLYLLQITIRRLRRPWSLQVETKVRSRMKVPWMEMPEFIRRFFAEDHEWLTARMERRTPVG